MNASLSTAAPWWRPDTGHRLIVRGGRPLVGTYPVSGAKNAVLPLMVSALLTPHLVTLRNVPANLDVAVLAVPQVFIILIFRDWWKIINEFNGMLHKIASFKITI